MTSASVNFLELQGRKLRAEQSKNHEALCSLDRRIRECAGRHDAVMQAFRRSMSADRERAAHALPGSWQAVLRQGERSRINRQTKIMEGCRREVHELNIRSAQVRERLRAGSRRLEHVEKTCEAKRNAIARMQELGREAADVELQAVLRHAQPETAIERRDEWGPGAETKTHVAAAGDGSEAAGPGEVTMNSAVRGDEFPAAQSPCLVQSTVASGGTQEMAAPQAAAAGAPVRPLPKGEIDAIQFSRNGGSSEMSFAYRTAEGQNLQVVVSQAANRFFVNLHPQSGSTRYRLMAQGREISRALRAAGVPVADISFRRERRGANE